jgi:hypothetical protein
MSIRVVIFSRDRALQLDAVLHSFYMHCADADSADISVLYLATDDRHRRQYQSVAASYPDVAFLPQKDFRHDLLTVISPYEKDSWQERIYFLLGAAGHAGVSKGLLDRISKHTVQRLRSQMTEKLLPSLGDASHILFLVDDNIFVRNFQLSEGVGALESHPSLMGCSLRLGENTVFCYSHNSPQKLPAFIDLDEKLIMFDWTQAEHDFGYPLEVSSSIYRLRDLLPFLMGLHFSNPNTLEEQISSNVSIFRSRYPLMCCYRHSVTFCNPINKVQTILPNRAAEQYRYHANELADRFERGERIKVDAYNNFTPTGCHQEVELFFERLR